MVRSFSGLDSRRLGSLAIMLSPTGCAPYPSSATLLPSVPSRVRGHLEKSFCLAIYPRTSARDTLQNPCLRVYDTGCNRYRFQLRIAARRHRRSDVRFPNDCHASVRKTNAREWHRPVSKRYVFSIHSLGKVPDFTLFQALACPLQYPGSDSI
jgi:hypothetical protein